MDSALDDSFAADIKEDKKNTILKKACSTIELYLADNVSWQVEEYLKSTKEIWERLENLYFQKNLSNKILLKEKLFGF